MASTFQTPGSNSSTAVSNSMAPPASPFRQTTAATPVAQTPASMGSSTNTYTLARSPTRTSKKSGSDLSRLSETYRPRVMRTCGEKPACLVSASVTYCGNNQIYAFGGFDQYTDEGTVDHVSILASGSPREISIQPRVETRSELAAVVPNRQLRRHSWSANG